MKKWYLRVPLILFPYGSALLSSMTTAFMKGVSEELVNETILWNLTHPIAMILGVLVVINIYG